MIYLQSNKYLFNSIFMKKQLLFILFAVNTCFGQNPFLEINLNDFEFNISIKDAYLFKDEQTNSYYAILEEFKETHGIKFDDDKTLKKQIVSDGLKRKYKEIIGHIIQDDKILLIQKNSKGNKFAYIKYDFTTGQTIEAEYEFKDRSDRFVESFVTPDHCIIYTINVSDDTLKKWEYKIDGTYTVKNVNIDSQFVQNGIEEKKLADYIVQAEGFSNNIELVKINNKIPNNIEIAANPNKMFKHEDGFIWTLDEDLNHTIVINFNYPDFEPTLSLVTKSELENTWKAKSNSFIFEDKIAQVISNNKELIVDIKSLNNPNNTLKSYRVNRDDKINFKNTEILQEGSMYSFGNTRKMEKTSKLLRKMSSEDNGISVNKNQDKYHFTIGGKRKQASGSPMMMTGGFGGAPIGGMSGAITVSFNPTFYAYDMYSNTGSTRIECLFDENFNHVEGEIDTNVFDKVDDYKEANDKIIKVESITYLNNKVIFGYLNTKADKYVFKSFEL